MITRPFYSFMLISSLFVLAGCNTVPVAGTIACAPGKAGSEAGPALVGKEYGQMTINPIPLNAVIFNKSQLAQLITVQSISASRTDNGNVKIEARLASCSPRPLSLVARAHFLGGTQALAEPISAWKSVPLQGGGLSYFSETSFTRDIKNYLIEIDAEGI